MDSETPAEKLDTETRDPRFMLSLARGLLVLRAFEQAQTLTLASASRLTGLPRATVRRCFYTLQKLGYLKGGEEGFRLTRKIRSLAGLFHEPTDVFAKIQDILNALTKTTGEPCVFGAIDGEDALIIARAAPAGRIVSFNLGKKIALHCSGLGRMCLASWPTERLEKYLRHATFTKFTEKTKCTPKELHAAIDSARRLDYALVNDELELGVRALSVPVRDSAQLTLGAVSVITVRLLSRAEIKLLLQQVQSAAREIGLLLATAKLGSAEILDLSGTEPGV